MYKLKKENISGISPIIIGNAEEDSMILNIEGDSYQEVETGKNKAIIPDKEENFHSMAINIKNGVITITGTSDVTYTSYKVVGTAKLEAGKKYYLRLWGSKSGSAALFKDSENQWFPDSENQEYEFTPTVGGTYNIQLRFGGGENQNWNARYSISETSNSDWVEGKEATPTLENPSEVEAVGDSGSAKITESNKNLAKIILTDKWELTENGIKNKGWINAVNLTEVPIFKGQILKLNLVLLSSVAHDITFSIYINDVYTPEYNFTSLQKMEVNTLYTRTINVEEDGILRITAWENGEEKEFFEFQLWAEEDTVTSYVEHKENIYTIPIQKPFYKLGDYKDSFVRQEGKWYEQHYINKFDLSSTYWSVGSVQSGKDVNTKRWNSTNTLNNNYDEYDNNAISNYFNTNLSSTLWGTDLIGFNLENNKVNIRLPVETASSADEVKTFWQEKAQTQVPYIYYILATPELIECTEEQSEILNNLQTYDGQNIIAIDTYNNTKPNISIDYTPKMTDEIKQAFTKNITKAYVIRTRDGFEINQDNYLKDYKLEELRFVPDNGFIGGTVARRLTLDFNNVDNQFDIQDEDLRFFAGVEYEGKDYYIDYGNFIVQKPETENTTDNTNATCLDYMCLLNATYNDEMTYPCTLGELAENVCSQAGLELATKTFRNSDFIVTDNQFVNNEPLRTVLGAIALSAFSWARIGQDNRVYIDFTIKQQEDISLDYDSYFNLSMASKPFGPINRIILRNSQVEGENITVQDDESIAENGVHELVIADNPFAYTQEKREQLIEAGKEFYGFTYMPINSMDTIGYAFLDSNSLIKVTDMQNKSIYAYAFNHTIDYNGALLDSIESPALTETETKYTYTPEEVQKQRRTEIIVNKHEQTITSIIQEQDELTNRQNVLEQNLDSTTNTISEVNEDLTERINQLQVNLDGLSQTVSQKGGDNIFSYDKEFWTGDTDDDVSNLEEYTDTDIQQNSVSGVGYIINKGTSRQNVQVKNDTYTISFTYKKLVELATGYVLINGTRYDLTSTNWDEIVVTLDVNTNYVDFEIISDTNKAFEIFDLMGSIGNEKQVWTQNANETRTDTVKIGKGITVSSSLTNTIWKADADGNRIINTDTGETVAEFTDKGTVTKNIKVKETAEIAGILIQEIDGQTWISSLL